VRQLRSLDYGSLAVMAITLVLFIGAVFTKGFTHDLLLEAGVFLVSVKLIIMAYKNKVSNDAVLKQLVDIQVILLREKGSPNESSISNTQPS
jgi:hypothetical protein